MGGRASMLVSCIWVWEQALPAGCFSPFHPHAQCQGDANCSRSLQGSPSPQQISHPCYPKGYRENISMTDLYNSPCVRAPSTPSPAQVLTVTGTGDPDACSSAIQKLFNFSCGANRTCGFNGVYQPPVRGQFFVRSLCPRGCGGGVGLWGTRGWPRCRENCCRREA